MSPIAINDRRITDRRITDRLIVCIASDWGVDPTSKHHVMRELSRHNDVVWVNYHGSRRPVLTTTDARGAWSALRRVFAGAGFVGDRMVQTTPLVIPGATNPVQIGWNRRIIARAVARARRHFNRHHRGVQLWTFAPDVDYLPGAFGEECVVYYCVDEFSQFAGYDTERTLAAEGRLMAAADIVLTSSADLYTTRARRHGHVHLVRHGVDYAHFRSAVDRALPVPDPIASIRGPVVGFVGLVEHWIDVRLIAQVARHLCDVAFVIVGACRADVTALRSLDNVHLVGRQPYASLPAYLSRFDVGIIPFQLTTMTRNVNPIKLREYLAAGLPVVSTNLPEVRRMTPHVTIASTPDAFAQAIRRCIGNNRVAARLARSLAVTDQDWSRVTAQVSQLVRDRIDHRRTHTTAPAPF